MSSHNHDHDHNSTMNHDDNKQNSTMHDNHDHKNSTDHQGDHNNKNSTNHGDFDNAGGMSHGGHGGMGMSPYLFSRTDGFFVLFQEANIESTGAFIGALFASFFFAIIATFLSQLFHIHEKKFLASGKPGLYTIASIMHAFSQLLHYIAMLIVMTMNIWLILVVVAGHAIGWLFSAFILAKKRQQQDDIKADGTADNA